MVVKALKYTILCVIKYEINYSWKIYDCIFNMETYLIWEWNNSKVVI